MACPTCILLGAQLAFKYSLVTPFPAADVEIPFPTCVSHEVHKVIVIISQST